MPELFSTLLESLSANPWLAAGLIILASFLLEDVTTIAACSLAVAGVISPPVALGALYIGLVVGDAGLYGLGRWAKTLRIRKGIFTGRHLVKGRRWLRGRLISVLVSARVMPGMRFPTFLASGFLRVSFPRFMGIIALMAAVWTLGIYAIIYFIGPQVAEHIANHAWLAGIVVLAVLLGPTLVRRLSRLKRA